MAGIVDKFKRMWDAPDDEYEYDEYGYADESVDEYEEMSSSRDRSRDYDRDRDYTRDRDRDRDRQYSPSTSRNKVVNINATAKLQVGIFKPERFGEETRAIADDLLKTHTVVLNLEDTNKDMARRILDFLSGVAYANSGKIKRVATNTYIIIPSNVDLTGDDLLDELENSGVYF